jgi:5'-AMP-activated protein kinase, catalytic alpha subunit
MEFLEPEIIGDENGRPVALTLDFPPPLILPCTLEKLRVITVDYGVIESYCLFDSTSDVVYELEERHIKETLYGTVHRGWIVQRIDENTATRTSDMYQVAVKKYDRAAVESKARADDPMQEFSALQFIAPHPNVISQMACYGDDESFFSVMPFCDGADICEAVLGNGPMRESNAKYMFLQFLEAMEHIQQFGIFHRDISMENVMVLDDDRIVLIDFGMCVRLPVNPDTGEPHLIPAMTPMGKEKYIAPEVLAAIGAYDGFKADIWASGILLFVLLSCKFPVGHPSPLCPFYRKIEEGYLREMCTHWKLGLSADCADLLYRMLQTNPDNRPTIQQIRAHRWFST